MQNFVSIISDSFHSVVKTYPIKGKHGIYSSIPAVLTQCRYNWFLTRKNIDKFSLMKKELQLLAGKHLYRINIKYFTSKNITLVLRLYYACITF